MKPHVAGEREGAARQRSRPPRLPRIRWEHVCRRETIRRLPAYPPAAYHSLFNPIPEGTSEVCGPVNQTGFDLVTIVFGEELDLLALQARSFARFLPDDFSGNILVVVNDLRCGRLVPLIERRIAPRYGRWHKRVRVVPFHRLARRLDPSNGWVIQQALKLSSSKIIDRPFYVVFDAKNHLVAPMTTAHLFDASGAARQPRQPAPDCMSDHQAACAAYLGGDAERGAAQFVPMTPFILHTATTRELVGAIEARERRDLSDFFCDTRLMSEFLLYGVHIGRTPERMRQLYVDTVPFTVTLWPDSGPIEPALEATRDARIVCFGVHRKVLRHATAVDLARLAHFWRARGLLRSGEKLAGLALRSDKPTVLRRCIGAAWRVRWLAAAASRLLARIALASLATRRRLLTSAATGGRQQGSVDDPWKCWPEPHPALHGTEGDPCLPCT